MNRRTSLTHALRAGFAGAAVIAVAACGSAGSEAVSSFHAPAHAKAPAINKAALLHPKRKYYGVFTPSAPADLSSIDDITTETGKQPNLDLYFQAWGAGAKNGTANLNTKTATNACDAGLLPLYTWESWDTKDLTTTANVHNGTNTPGVKWAQPAYAPSKITAGDFDPYIKATADRIASLASIGCPVALRFDQEFNGYWYPWGEGNTGMSGTPTTRAAEYIKMWRHVWKIFKAEGATNVIWVWSPNFQSLKHTGYPAFNASYPGDKYVDWVGMDGYYYNSPKQTFTGLFGPTITQLKAVAPKKPWLVAETGVGTYPDASIKPKQITNLLHAVATKAHFNGMVYFDQFKPYDRSDWRFDADKASLAAFKAGINSSAYAAGKPGSF